MAKFITSDHVAINYHDVGGKLNPPIVLAGGYSSSEVTWLYQVEPLLAAGFRVITYDHRAHGASSQVEYGLTAARLAMDLHELLDYLELEYVILIGHSMGAVVVMTYETLFTDQRLRAIITEDQNPTIMQHDDWLGGKSGLSYTDIPVFMGRLPQLRLMVQPLSETMKRAMQPTSFPFNFKVGRTLLLDTIVQDWRATLKQEQIPHLFIAGERSPLYPAEHAQAARMLQNNANSRAYVIPNVGHIPHLENVDEFNRLLLEFLTNLA